MFRAISLNMILIHTTILLDTNQYSVAHANLAKVCGRQLFPEYEFSRERIFDIIVPKFHNIHYRYGNLYAISLSLPFNIYIITDSVRREHRCHGMVFTPRTASVRCVRSGCPTSTTRRPPSAKCPKDGWSICGDCCRCCKTNRRTVCI